MRLWRATLSALCPHVGLVGSELAHGHVDDARRAVDEGDCRHSSRFADMPRLVLCHSHGGPVVIDLMIESSGGGGEALARGWVGRRLL